MLPLPRTKSTSLAPYRTQRLRFSDAPILLGAMHITPDLVVLFVLGLLGLIAIVLLGGDIPNVMPFGSTRFGSNRGQQAAEQYYAEEELRRREEEEKEAENQPPAP